MNQSPFISQLSQAIKAQLPESAGPGTTEYVTYWSNVVASLTAMYARLSALSRWLNGKNCGSQLIFSPADILKAELFTDTTGQRLKQTVDQEVDRQCTALATAFHRQFLLQLVNDGRAYRVRQYGASTRLTLKLKSGEAECDLLCEPHPLPDRILGRLRRKGPAFVSKVLSVHTARCIRLVDGQKQLLPCPGRAVELVQIGEFAILVRPVLFPEPRPVRSAVNFRLPGLPQLLVPDLSVVTATLSCGVPVVLLAYGVIFSRPLPGLAGGFLLMTVLLFFLKRAVNASNP